MATEKRLIDANRLKKVLDDSLEGTYTLKDPKTASVMAGTIIACGILVDEIPTEDAVEVVRCKNCKFAYINSFSASQGVVLCRHWTNQAAGKQAVTNQDSFCSYGERKNDG